MREGKCEYCGKVFLRTGSGKIYCSIECRKAARNLRVAANKEQPRKKRWEPTENEKAIIEICRKAKPMRLSYGQYVIRYGGGADVRGKEVSTASGTV